MLVINLEETFSPLDLDQYSIDPLTKIIDKRGYIYIGVDSVFPNHFKIGRTGDLSKRLQQYNSDKPYPTFNYIIISTLFTDCIYAEKKILDSLYKQISPTTLKYEWFERDCIDICTDLIEKAETTFD